MAGVLVFVGAFCLFPLTTVAGQVLQEEGSAPTLAGVREVLANYWFSASLSVDSDDLERWQRLGQSEIELRLRREGLKVGSGTHGVLNCEVRVASVGPEPDPFGYVYTWDVKFISDMWPLVIAVLDGEPKPETGPYGDIKSLFVVVWQAGGIATGTDFDPDDVAGDCADAFANEWLAQNPDMAAPAR
jgi:hypothetical protein